MTAATTNSNLTRGRLDHIDGLRALAAVYVVLHHILLYLSDDLPDGKVRFFTGFLIFGHYAVDVFIVLSGFCLMLPVIKNGGVISGGAGRFFFKRARRILPPYYAVIAISLALIALFIGTGVGQQWKSSLPITPLAIISHLLLFQDYFSATNHKINYSMWSISVEWRIYFLFPFLVYLWRKIGAFATFALTSTIAFLLLIPLSLSPLDSSASGVCIHYYGLFTFGMLAAALAYAPEGPLLKWRTRFPWGIFWVAMALAAFAGNKGYIHGYRLPWQGQDLFVGLSTLCLLVAVTPSETSDSWRPLRNALSWEPLVFVGTFSYSLYLLHAPLLEIIWVYLIQPLHLSTVRSFFLFSSAGLAIVIGLSYLCFILFERPFIGGGRKGPGGAGFAKVPTVIPPASDAVTAIPQA